MSASVRVTKLERTIRTAAREDYVKRVHADFDPAVARAANDDAAAKLLMDARSSVIKTGAKAAEEAALEQFLSEKAPALAVVPAEKFTKLDAKGNALPADATEFAAVAINPLRIIVAKIVGKQGDHASITKWATELKHMDLDWKPISRVEALAGIWDPTRREPAYDPAFWNWIPTNDWIWTRDPLVGSSTLAWSVYFNYGYSYASYRASSGFGLAVASFPASQ